MSVPQSRQLASVLRTQLGVVSDSPVVYPAATAAGSPPDGYANVDIGGTVYTVPSILGAFNRDPDTGAQVAGETAYLLVTHDSILAVGRPDLPEYELPPVYGSVGGGELDVVYPCKVFADAIWPDDASLVLVGDARLVVMVDDDMDDWTLTRVQGYLTTPGSAVTTVQLRNITGGNVDLLDPRLTIDAGELQSKWATVQPVVKPSPTRIVQGVDLIAIDVDTAGAGARGLGVYLTFSPPP
jgi:hypothetical protein